jgi:Delta7-sterol 5-desaturase
MDYSLLTGNKTFWSILTVIALRYVVLAFLAFLVFYIIKKKSWFYRKIQQRFPLRKDYWREIAYSIITAFIFAGVGVFVFVSPFRKLTQVYTNIEQYSVTYFVVSILLMLVIHDTYFYWTHRWMHLKPIFRLFHKVHHLSTNPSPWAAMAFHPLEAVVEAGVIAVIAVAIPSHPLAIGIFLLIMMIYNVYGHLGYELYPKGFSKSVIGKWINTSFCHNQHHQYFEGNYGLYFLLWDRWMGTLRNDYDEMFDVSKSR